MIIDNEKIETLLKRRNMSKSKLAVEMEKATMTIIRKLKGRHDWSFNEVWKLTQILDVEMNDLLKKEEA